MVDLSPLIGDFTKSSSCSPCTKQQYSRSSPKMTQILRPEPELKATSLPGHTVPHRTLDPSSVGWFLSYGNDQARTPARPTSSHLSHRHIIQAHGQHLFPAQPPYPIHPQVLVVPQNCPNLPLTTSSAPTSPRLHHHHLPGTQTNASSSSSSSSSHSTCSSSSSLIPHASSPRYSLRKSDQSQSKTFNDDPLPLK